MSEIKFSGIVFDLSDTAKKTSSSARQCAPSTMLVDLRQSVSHMIWFHFLVFDCITPRSTYQAPNERDSFEDSVSEQHDSKF